MSHIYMKLQFILCKLYITNELIYIKHQGKLTCIVSRYVLIQKWRKIYKNITKKSYIDGDKFYYYNYFYIFTSENNIWISYYNDNIFITVCYFVSDINISAVFI